jgi:hypothetical protein
VNTVASFESPPMKGMIPFDPSTAAIAAADLMYFGSRLEVSISTRCDVNALTA